MDRFALVSRQKLNETTVGFPREKKIETIVRFALIRTLNLIETTLGFAR